MPGLSWPKFVNTHLYHSRQWFNLHATYITLQQYFSVVVLVHFRKLSALKTEMSRPGFYQSVYGTGGVLSCGILRHYGVCKLWDSLISPHASVQATEHLQRYFSERVQL